MPVTIRDLIEALTEQGVNSESHGDYSMYYRCKYCKCSWGSWELENHSHGCFIKLAEQYLEENQEPADEDKPKE